MGDQIDLFKFPVPLIHNGDGGRYINTWGTIVVQTPDATWTNWSIARIMLQSKNTMVGLINPRQHVGMIHGMWNAINKPTPFALALGSEPAIPYVSGMPLPAYVNEADFIGGYLRRALEVIRCETVDLYVPATSEIIIEGYISNTEKVNEGPMGEYAGYLESRKEDPYLHPSDNKKEAAGSHLQPVYHVTAITHRNNPILPVVTAGAPIEENHTWGNWSCYSCIFRFKEKWFPGRKMFCSI